MNTKLLLILFIAGSFFSKAQSPCFNMDFESSSPGNYSGASNSLSVSGWTITSQTVNQCSQTANYVPGSPEFTIAATPVFSVPLIGTIPHSPLGGTLIAALNYGSVNSSSTRLSRDYTVTTSNSLFQFAHAGYYADGGHSCCEQPAFLVEIRDSLGNMINCLSKDFNVCNAGNTFTVTTGVSWNNWQVQSIDLSPLIGSKITIHIISKDCIYGGHQGFTFIDAKCGTANTYFSCNCNQVGPSSPVSFCAGSGSANIQAPLGYTNYSWTAPSGFSISAGQATLAVITITNPVVGATFTVQVSNNQCNYFLPYTLNTSTVSISGLGITSPCQNYANGSATVIANGSAGGYSYMWTNSSNSVISTSSVVANLASGSYTAQATFSGCGTGTVQVNVSNASPQVLSDTKYFCLGQYAYLQVNGGSNFQWYSGNSTISGATASSYTVISPQQNAIYKLGYNNPQGCRDSIIYTLQPSNPGKVVVTAPLVCPGSNNGTAVISMTPALAVNYYGTNNTGYWAYSTGTLTPSYSSTLAGSSLTTFTINNLAANGTYTIGAFDGSCYYTTGLTVGTYPPFDYTLTPSSVTVCSGKMIPAAVNFYTVATGEYTYLWTPNIFLISNLNTYPNTFITPTAAAGSVTTIVYSVMVTPTAVACPLTKTMAITVANPVTPTITAIPPICSNAVPFQVNAIPQGGYFSGTGAISQQAILNPALANIGSNTIMYSHGAGTCIITSTVNFIVVSTPTVSINGNLTVCSPGSTTLTANGASNYNWSSGGTGSSIIISPASSTLIIVNANNGNCTDSASVYVQVAPMPNVAISGNTAVCAGTQATLQATGANSFLWNNGSANSIQFVNPTQTTMYYVVGSNSSFCKDSVTVVVNVTPNPVLQISGNFSLCPGESSLLVATGASSYSWNTGATTGIIGVTPAQTTMYIVTGINHPANCSSTRSITVNVDACLGINERKVISGTTVYPNPVTQALTIENNENATLKIFNELGMLIFEEDLEKGKNTISTSQWVPGIYFVKVSGSLNVRVYRIVKAE